jgi:tetratricopeptide (TPR) repeat protein
MLLSCLGMPMAHAQVIDNIDVVRAGKEAEIRLHFITDIRYVRNVVLNNGDIRIYVTLLNIDPKDTRLIWEKKESPPTDLVKPFTVTYPELDSSLTLSFGKKVTYRVVAGTDGQSVSIFTPVAIAEKASKSGANMAPAIVALPVVVPSTTIEGISGTAPASSVEVAPQDAAASDAAGKVKTPEEIDQQAQKYFIAASDALQANQIDKSVEMLNKLLDLPPNALSQPAQELMGEAREKNGEFDKARAEYELYLKLYPKASDAKQVMARLAALPKENKAEKLKGEPSLAEQKAREEKLQVSGGVSQSYYSGVTHTETFAIDGAGNVSTSTFDGTDQSQLISTFDLTARKRTDTLDSRMVIREYNRLNFLPQTANDYRWNAIYIEQSARDRKFMYRFGRQSGSWGGLPGRFDGLAGGYSLNETWRINLAMGKPVEYTGSGWDPGDNRLFYSGAVELTRLPNQWSGSAYGILQTVGGAYSKFGGTGIADRAAVGMEAHFFETNRNYMFQMEYDKLFGKVNLVTFQGNWNRPAGDTFYVMLDHRRSPPLAFNMQGQFTQSVKEMLSKGAVSVATLRDNAIALSTISNMAAVGASKPVTEKLRLATDFRISNSGGTGQYVSQSPDAAATPVTLPGSPGTGNQYTFNVQAIGNNLLFNNDLGIANFALSKTDTTTGQSLTFTQVNTIKSKLRLDASLLVYRSNNSSAGTTQTQIRPSVTTNYRLNDSLNLTAEAGIEQYKNSGATSNDKTRRSYFYVGYRWDFR